MAKAVYVQGGTTIDYIPAADVAAGDVVVSGKLVGIAYKPIPAGTRWGLAVWGVYRVAKDGTALTFGQEVYWDDANKLATATAQGNTFMGLAVEAAAAGDATVLVRLG